VLTGRYLHMTKEVLFRLLTRRYTERKATQKQAEQANDAVITAMYEYYDKRQLVRKILLNSAYECIIK